jgi:hypothetical protein
VYMEQYHSSVSRSAARITATLQYLTKLQSSRRVSLTTSDINLKPVCNSDQSQCTLNYDPDISIPYAPILSAAPLIDCDARSIQSASPTWTITNITYFDLSLSHCFDCIPQPSAGRAYIYLYISPIDFFMRCSPDGTDLGVRSATGSTEWHRCDTGYDLGNPPDTPPTWVKFDQFTWEVTLRQDWNCTGVDGDV